MMFASLPALLLLATSASAAFLTNPSYRTGTFYTPYTNRFPATVPAAQTAPFQSHAQFSLARSVSHLELLEANLPFTSRVADGMTPSLTYYLPTGKCPAKWFCRVEITVYKEFQGKTVVQVGYSVWHFDKPNVAVPASALRAIAATTDAEIRSYVGKLGQAMGEEYPLKDDLCPISFPQAMESVKKVVDDMAGCTETHGVVCMKDTDVDRCD